MLLRTGTESEGKALAKEGNFEGPFQDEAASFGERSNDISS